MVPTRPPARSNHVRLRSPENAPVRYARAPAGEVEKYARFPPNAPPSSSATGKGSPANAYVLASRGCAISVVSRTYRRCPLSPRIAGGTYSARDPLWTKDVLTRPSSEARYTVLAGGDR